MINKNKCHHIAAGAFLVTGLSSYVSSAISGEAMSPEDDIFSLKEIHTMQPCYWLSREIPAEGLCGEKMRPDVNVLTQEAEKGNNIAAMRLGQLYESGNWGITKNLDKAVKWYSHAAQLGDRKSQILMGNAYEFGRLGVQEDIRLAIQYYSMATENGIYPELEERIGKLEKMLTTGN